MFSGHVNYNKTLWCNRNSHETLPSDSSLGPTQYARRVSLEAPFSCFWRKEMSDWAGGLFAAIGQYCEGKRGDNHFIWSNIDEV